MIISGHGAVSVLKTGFAGLGLALCLVLGLAVSADACCYDPPENDTPSEQVSAPAAEQAAALSAPPASTGTPTQQTISAEADEVSVSSAPRFVMIQQMMAEARYLRARQLAESRLRTRPYDHHLWALLEQIYGKLGLQGRTVDAAYQAGVTHPDWQPPAPPPPPISAQKRYVAKLLQSVREFKPID